MKILIALCLLLSFTIGASAQKVRFSDTSNRWKTWYKYSYYIPTTQYQFYSKDSVVNDTLYHLFLGQWFMGQDTSCTRFLVREDSALGRVYVRAYVENYIQDSKEVLLYDYALGVGDTVRWGGFGFVDSGIYQVFEIDSVEMFDAWHKVWKLESVVGGFWDSRVGTIIEGVGCTGGPFMPLISPNPFEEDFKLLCFSRAGIYPTVLSDCTEPYDGVQEIGGARPERIDIYPIPATSQIECFLPAAAYVFEIRNCLGQVVEQWSKDGVVTAKDITRLEPGLYWLVAWNCHTSLTYRGKFIKY